MNAKPSILLVEDVAEDINVLSHILKDDYQLSTAKDGEQGLAMAVENRPDLILLDIVLPGKTGFVVLEKLKTMKETADIPVIIITAIDSVQYEEKGLNLGAVDYITKPFHNSVVLARLRTHVKILQYVRDVEQIAWSDPVTGLPNRERFDRRIEQESELCRKDRKPLGLLLIELDRFREYDELHGREQTGLVLKKTAEIITGSLADPDQSCFRYGEDRFAVLLPNTESTKIRAMAESIRGGIETMPSYFRQSPPAPVKADIGMALAGPDRDDIPGALISEAEESLRAAKSVDGDRARPE